MSVPLALLGALLFAVSATLQQHSAHATARRLTAGRPAATGEPAAPVPPARARRDAPPPVRRLLARVAREPLWWFGWLAGAAGFAAQAVALHLGSIVIVQALVVTQLLFAVPLGSVFTGRRPPRRDWWGAAAVCAGLVVLVAVRGGAGHTAVRRSETWLVAGAAAVLILLLLLTARLLRSHPQSRTVALAAAAGICFCMTAVFLVFAGDDVSRHGVLAAALRWPVAGLCVSTAAGTVLAQNAFAAGTLPTALTAMNITDPVASAIVGMAVLDVRPAADPGALWATAAAVLLIASGVGILATSPTMRALRPAR